MGAVEIAAYVHSCRVHEKCHVDAAPVLHSPLLSGNGLVERMFYDHPQSTGPTTATNFERSIK